jgi:peptidoglycan-N-acetylglucosamine deacetylase
MGISRDAAGRHPRRRDKPAMTGRLSLTFDNGPTPGITERILEVLARHGLRVTFFVIGEKLRDKAAAGLLAEMAAAGHWIGNHTLTHSVALGDRPDAAYARTEIEEAQALVGTWPGQEKLFRPYGKDGLLGRHLFSVRALAHLQSHRYTSVIWNMVPGDWMIPDGWDDRCIDDLNRLDDSEWAVVVLHDIPNACLAGLDRFLTRIEDGGFSIEQQFPDSVVITRNGRSVTSPAPFVADGLPT